MFTDIEECISCHGEHLEVWLNEMIMPLNIGIDVYKYWYICPTTDDTIYIKDAETYTPDFDDKYRNSNVNGDT